MRCDSHVHIVGPLDRFPQAAKRHYTAAVAELATLRALASARGIGRFVIVQPSFYEDDNAALLEALDALGDNGRGVAVIDAAKSSPAMLADYARRGVRGLRVNLYSGLGEVAPFDIAFRSAARAAQPMNWHVEAIAGIGIITANAALIAQSNVPVVIDHYGVYGDSLSNSTQARALLDLLRLPHVWMKLSAPYRVSGDPLASKPDPAWLKAILACGSDRLVWGSDWPHTPPPEQHKGAAGTPPYRDLSYGGLVEDFLAALASPVLARQIMEANPARLYEFPGST